jgi:diguanylate cyclase (GGDEF)-like protein
MVNGELDAAAEQITLGQQALDGLEPMPRFALGVLHCTHSEVEMRASRPEDALRNADRAIGHLVSGGDANPYVLGMAVLSKVQALLALDRVEDARRTGERVVERLGDRVPQARAMILAAVADALRGAGRVEEAYDALARCAELEREAMQEFSRLQLGLERTRLEITAARHEADALNAKNRRLQELVAELNQTKAELEQRERELLALQEGLRDQADRDFLTGLGNRRYLARARETAATDGAVSFAVLDLDHFKTINDRFGHQAGDAVLVRIAQLLVSHLRAEDTVVRTGGEEFALLMPGTPLSEATACCERLRELIEAEPWDVIAAGLTVTASIGVSGSAHATDLVELERSADLSMYRAKRGGRNRVICS